MKHVDLNTSFLILSTRIFSDIGVHYGSNTSRTQCSASSCLPTQNVDSIFGVNFFNIDVPQNETGLKITIKTKKAANGQSGKYHYFSCVM